MALHVEDEFALAQLGGGELRIQPGVVGDLEESAVAAGTRVRGVEGQQRRCGSAQRGEKRAPRAAQFTRQLTGPFLRQVIRVMQ